MRNRLTDELAVCGLNTVFALAENHPEQINRLFLREDRLHSFTKLCKSLAERKRPYKICEDEELERISKSTHHQGLVAMIHLPKVEPLSQEDIEEWAQEGSVGLVLHSVENDHNLGAMVRSAAFFDVKYIVVSEKETETRLTTSAYRIAEGGMEHVIIKSIRNTESFLKDVSRSEVNRNEANRSNVNRSDVNRTAARQLLTIGTDIRARQRIGDLPRIIGKTRPGIALVLGNEETGLPPEVKTACSVLLRIPGTGLMESLNVAQTATLFMHRIFEL